MNRSERWMIARSERPAPLLEVLASHLDVSRKQAKRFLDARQVFVNQQRVWMARHTVKAGDHLEVLGSLRPATPPALAVVREQADWLVINKPAGLLSNGPDSAEEQLRTLRKEPELEAVHRLDRDTSGCLLFSRRPAARPALVELFEDKAIHKTYVALVQGRFTPHQVRVDKALDGLSASTDFRVLMANARASLVEARPLTGRTHQIRLHLRELGYPLAGDRVYATGVVEDKELRRLPRQMLHASELVWRNPEGGPVAIKAPWPDDFQRAVAALGLRLPKPCGGT